jgi:competence protein ComEC
VARGLDRSDGRHRREIERNRAGISAASLRVLKVPHHGSLTSSSSAFIHALAPRLAIISVGRSNRFGHLAPAVLNGMRTFTEVFRTDRDGAVTVDTDGTS